MLLPTWLRLRKSARQSSKSRCACRARFLPAVFILEDRTVPSTFTVLNTNDSGPDSLRQAIIDANATPGLDTIAFNIGGGGVQTIQPLIELPTITAPVIVDGYT